MVLPGLSLFDEAQQDVFGANAAHATLRDVSGFEDPQLVALLQCLREEAERPVANPSHFAHVFRLHTGLSPSDYRRQRQGSAGRR
ncbi:bacterial regulatory helix-turn-helix s, AraC family protein [Pseudomonas fluorescens]|uniref:Bacterial regulatory helix-turn-helix s, AraC family protein n=1 Tax=Pseudomonas fluorescens TaxID=294 RepID=A0A0N8NXP1_PSEFL|nr:AraC family transcriptional regulator [Pseudomonas fluorescens]KPU60745.1 bacterial regulatory helix-turn-helix s, AraC family protein [Pseudomonas fluorescens]